jgi:hypothetical protein
MNINYRELALVWYAVSLGMLGGSAGVKLFPETLPYFSGVAFIMFSGCMLYLADCEFEDSQKKKVI